MNRARLEYALALIAGVCMTWAVAAPAFAAIVDCNRVLRCNNPYPCPPYTCCTSYTDLGCKTTTCPCNAATCSLVNGVSCKCLTQTAPCVACVVADGNGTVISAICEPKTCVPGQCEWGWTTPPEMTCLCP